MKKISFVSLGVMVWCGTAYAELSYFPDVNKTYDDDTQMCWAAAAANTLAWTGWGIGNEYDIMKEFKDYYPDVQGAAYNAWVDYFSWHYPSFDLNDYFQSSNPFIPTLANCWLSAGYGVTFDTTGHTMTLWGVDTNSQGIGVRVRYSNSDDNFTGVRTQDIIYQDGSYYFGYVGGYSSMGQLMALAPNPGFYVGIDLHDPVQALADFDGDGLSNLMEFSLGADPRNPLDGAKSPLISVTTKAANQFLTMQFKRRTNATVLGLQYLPEVSADGQTWYSDPAHVQEVNATALDTQFDWVTVQDETPTTPTAARFFRLRVVEN